MAPPGRVVDPAAVPPKPDKPQPAPAHGTPVGPQELARLKRRARNAPPGRGAPAQEEDQANPGEAPDS
jgi:hypothetical protein